MKLISDELYELMMDNIEDKAVREKVFAEQVNITTEDRSALCSALETDINYWENCMRTHPNEKDSILNHIRRYIHRDNALMAIFH